MKREDLKIGGVYESVKTSLVVVCTGLGSSDQFEGFVLHGNSSYGFGFYSSGWLYSSFNVSGLDFKPNYTSLKEGNTYSIQDGCEIVVTEDNRITIVNSIKYYVNDEQHKTMALKVSKNNTLTVDIYNDNKAFIGRYKRNKDKDPAIPRSAREIDEKEFNNFYNKALNFINS